MSNREVPTVDVVIDNFNYARFLPAAIDSALAQTHPKVRVLVVDDGSTDESREVIAGYGERIEAVLKENGGQASAINAGFARCEADVVIFLDADDTLAPSAAADVAAAFAADPELVKVQFRAAVIDAAGQATGAVKPAAHLPMPDGNLRATELASPYDIVWMATSANAFRREALRRVMPIPEQAYRTCADWYLVHTTALLGPVRSLAEIDGGYRMHGSNNYEPQSVALDLDHIRETIGFAAVTSQQLLRLAPRLGLAAPRRILSTADLANRMISLRLEPDRHPVGDDTRLGLLRDARQALRRRATASAAMKAMLAAWFAAMAVAPRPLARRLAVAFLFPQRRRLLNRLLASQHRDGRDGGHG